MRPRAGASGSARASKLHLLKLLDQSLEQAEGARPLSRALEWHFGSISGVKRGDETVSPWHAVQMAQFLSLGRMEEDRALFAALVGKAKTASERAYWQQRAAKLEVHEPVQSAKAVCVRLRGRV